MAYSKRTIHRLFLLFAGFTFSIGLQAFQQQEEDTVGTATAFFYELEDDKQRQRFRFSDPAFKGGLSIFRYLPDENSESSINFDLGAEVEWEVQKRLFVGTGLRLFFISQNFPVGEERVQGRLANGALLAREHVSTDMSITGIEIPLFVRYKVSDNPGSLFLTLSLSSRTSIKEKYTDHIDWKMGGSVAGSFLATSTRSTVIRNESVQSFEFFNAFHAVTFGIGKSIHVYGSERGEIMIGYTLNVQDMKNIFQEARFKKYEALGLSIKFPLPIGKKNR